MHHVVFCAFFFLLFIVGEGWRGTFYGRKGGIGVFLFSSKISKKTNFSQQNNGRYDQILFLRPRC